MSSFKIVFAGTPEFSATTLHELIHSHHTVQAVYSQPDRPAGRGRKIEFTPVKRVAVQHHIPVYQPYTLRDEEEQQKLAALRPDLMIVVAYGLILPKKVLTIPRFGCVNVHASLLPRWRGAAPIQRAILAGDAKTGITIMQMDEGLDTGPMLYKAELPIHRHDTSASLHDSLAHLGAKTLLHVLDHLSVVKPEIQDNSHATYAEKIMKPEAELDWHKSADELDRTVRAFNPWPVDFFDHIRVWETKVIEKELKDIQPGTIVEATSQGIDVATGKNILRLLKLQLPGGRILSVADILNSRKQEFSVGTLLK